MGYSPWGHKELDTTELLSMSHVSHAGQAAEGLPAQITVHFKCSLRNELCLPAWRGR